MRSVTQNDQKVSKNVESCIFYPLEEEKKHHPPLFGEHFFMNLEYFNVAELIIQFHKIITEYLP